ncbi:restriction endonuclease subunit S [Cetobacterium sp.]|uniref:restriction endonuclease subunit S n=1 Tax=Cetobacterium sp. TaxID=2071632 RepID=UPI003F34E947
MKNKVPKLRFPEFSGEWEKKKIGDLMECIVPGRNKPQEFQGDIPWITTPDIFNKNFVYCSKNKLNLSKVEIKKVGSKIVPKNSVIMSCVGELGVVCIAGTDIVINQQLHAFLPNSKINNIFIKNSLLTKICYMEKIATKTALLYMNKDACNSIPISLPSLPEQEKIASFLSEVDTKIEKLEKKKELLSQYKKGMMQKLFSQKLRFKDENGNDYPEWEEKKLGEVLTIGNGKDYKHLNEGDIPVFGTGGYMTSVDKYLHDGETVFIGRKGTINKPFYYNGKFWTVDTLFYTHNFKNSFPKFIYVIFQNIDWLQYNEASGVPSLSKSTINNISINLPSLPEQEKIANFLSSIDRKIELVEEELEKNKKFKKGLLQQMFV